MFRTIVLGREADTHSVKIAVPKDPALIERRGAQRIEEFETRESTINGKAATLVNASGGGAMLTTSSTFHIGDYVHVEMPGRLGAFEGWVLGSTPEAVGTQIGCRVRIQFNLGDQGDSMMRFIAG